MEIKVGVDPHKDSHEVAACDAMGRELNRTTFPNTETGNQDALDWIQALDAELVVGVECSGSYGAVLTRLLVRAGLDVREVPSLLTHGERRRRPAQGKSDQVDALAIARAVARGEGLSLPKLGDIYEELKLLVDERKSLVTRKTQLINKTHSDLVILRPGYHREIPRLNRKCHIARARKLVNKDTSTRGLLVKARLKEIERVIAEISTIEKLIKAKVLESGTSLHHQGGISFVLAATIVGEVGDPGRIRSEGAFAMFNGTAPVIASSGRVNHHRLNRRGNRTINFAIHTVAVVRARRDERTRAFLAKKLSEGKTNKDAMRCLKRHISNDIYRQMLNDIKGMKSAA
ncbi:MAG: IS110 family transposase [Actinobacteria bacterium]|nr:IS110 family transposase [Actinomycetota bacterium]